MEIFQKQDLEQKNKAHRTLRDKLKHKRKREKEIMKEKQQKRKEYYASLESRREEFFSQQTVKKDGSGAGNAINFQKLFQSIAKFLQIYEDDLKDFYEIFNCLDSGEEVNTDGIQNQKIQKFLEKIFKYLHMTQQKSGAFIQKDNCPLTQVSLSIRKVCMDILDHQNELDYQSSEGEDEEASDQEEGGDKSDSSSVKGKQGQKSNKKRENSADKDSDESDENLEINEGSSDEDDGCKQQIQSDIDTTKIEELKVEPQKTLGPFIPLDQREKLAESVQNNIVQEKPVSNLMDDFLLSTLAQVDNKGNKISDFLNNRKNADNIPKKAIIDPERYAQGSARLEDDFTRTPEELAQYMKEYNALHRPKTLLEEHREIMEDQKKNKSSAANSNERRPFDRNIDLQVNKVNSKTLMRAIQQHNDLDSKFQRAAKVQKNFL